MSYDIQLAHVCPHLTIEEEVPLGEDRRSLNTLQPVGVSDAVVIRANGVAIPQDGLFSRAVLFGGFSGPFNVPKFENKVTVQNRTQSLMVTLPVGSRVSTKQVVDTLNAAFRNNGIQLLAESQNGVLKITDTSELTTGSQVIVSGGARNLLGFENQFRARGRRVYPGWDLAERPDLVTLAGLTGVKSITVRFPKFRSVVRGNPVFTVTYRTFQNKCRRCLSTGIENDYRLAASGNPLVVINEDKLNQDVLKILTTIKGSNPFVPEYGSRIPTRIGLKALPSSRTLINEDATAALRVFQRIQGLQSQLQEVTPREKLQTIVSVDTIVEETDPTIFRTEVIATNASNQPVVISTVFAAPGTAALAGSNGLSLGLEGLGLDPRTRTLPGIAVR